MKIHLIKLKQTRKHDDTILLVFHTKFKISNKYPCIAASWLRHWSNLNTLFNYPEDIRKAIYTTNSIESLNSVLRKAVNNRKIFPRDNSAKKVIYLAIKDASKKWTMPIRNWKSALNRFIVEFNDCVTEYI